MTQQFYVGKPDIDGSCIREWRFTAGEGESEVELCLPDETSAAETPMIFIAGRDGFTLEELEAFLPNLLAVLNDRRVLAARQRMAEGMPPVDDREAA